MNEESLFYRALEMPEGERAAYLDQACGGDAALRERLEKLLAAHDNPESFLQRSPVEADLLPTVPGVEGDAPAVNGATLDFLQPSDDPSVLGCLEHYDVLDIIGRGGMGLVLKARDQRLHRVVAIKVLAPEIASSPIARQRFLREAQAAAAVSHDHVVTIHAVSEANATPFLVMEYIAGRSLQERISQQGPLEIKEVLRIGMQTAAGLAAAHRQGLVHRDVKPANILLENGVERVKITDFGLARAVDDVGLTQTGAVAGTPLYMSPEQAQGRAVDHRSDLFSLGCVLYAMCTGGPPFRGESTVAVLHRICHDRPRRIRELNPDIPRWLSDIIGQLLEKDPDRRFASAEEVAEVLEDHLSNLQHPATAPQARRTARHGVRSQRRYWQIAAGALLLFLACIGMTEATGVTHVVPTIVRIAMGEGILVIEADDPNVSITVDGEEISIQGAGVNEIRLRPGTYQFRASQDGRPLREELVTVNRSGRTVVRVSREIGESDVLGGEWISLFNGKDLTGWETHPDKPDGWTVEDGVLVGRSRPPAYLFSTKEYEDFHLRAEARINDGGDSGIFFRAPFEFGLVYPNQTTGMFPQGYEALISGVPSDPRHTGSLMKDGHVRVYGREKPKPPGKWIVVEVIARGERLLVKINGRTTAHFTDKENPYRRGRLVLQAVFPGTEAEFRKIEIQEFATTAPTSEKTVGESAAFVLLGSGESQRKFDTLAEAVKGASHGDVIEIRGHGPFLTPPVKTGAKSLVIRAADGYSPILKLKHGAPGVEAHLIESTGPLVLEGLEFHRDGPVPLDKKVKPAIIECQGAPLYVANCRFLLKTARVSIWSKGADCEVRNCQFLDTSGGSSVDWECSAGGSFKLQNCIQTSRRACMVYSHEANMPDVRISITDNTFVGRDPLSFWLARVPAPQEDRQRTEPMVVQTAGNLFDNDFGFVFNLPSDYAGQPHEAEALLRDMLQFSDQRNVYDLRSDYLTAATNFRPLANTREKMSLAQWHEFWSLRDYGSLEGELRFAGGDILARASQNLEQLTPEDFRLSPDSAGYRAGPDGQDVGANIDIVGPGDAYKRWKITSDYQEWLNVTDRIVGRVSLESRPSAVVEQNVPPDENASLPSGYEVRRYFGHTAGVLGVGVSGDGKHILSSSSDGTARLWNLETGVELRRFVGHSDAVHSAAFLPDGKHMVSGSRDTSVRIWDVATGKELQKFTGHLGQVWGVAAFADGNRVASASWDRTVRVWNVGSARQIGMLELDQPVYGIALLPDERHVLCGCANGELQLWSLDEESLLRRLEGHTGYVKSLSISSDGRQALSAGGMDGTVRLWDLGTGTELKRFGGVGGWAHGAVFSRDGKLVVTCIHNSMALWDLETGRILRSYENGSAFSAVAVTPDACRVVSGSWTDDRTDDTVRLWELPESIWPEEAVLQHLAKISKLIEADSHDPKLLMQRGRIYGRLRRYEEGVRDFSRALDLLTEKLAFRARLAICEEFLHWKADHFESLVALRPTDINLWRERGEVMARREDWDEAARCFQKRLELGPDGAGLWQTYAVVLLAKDDNAYRRLCERMVSGFSNASDPGELRFVVHACVLTPDSVEDNQRVLRLAQRELAAGPDDMFNMRACAAGMYRCGRLEESIALFSRAAEKNTAYCDYLTCFLAMAHHRLGDADEAQSWRQRVYDWRANPDTAFYGWRVPADRLIAEMESVLQTPP